MKLKIFWKPLENSKTKPVKLLMCFIKANAVKISFEHEVSVKNFSETFLHCFHTVLEI